MLILRRTYVYKGLPFTLASQKMASCSLMAIRVMCSLSILWVFEAVVSAQEVVDCRRLYKTELVEENDVEDLR